MALPQVGLEAVIANLGQFQAGAKTIINAYNDINAKANSVEGVSAKLGVSILGLGSHLLNLGAIAGGAALAGVTALGTGLATFAVTGINKAIDLDQQMSNIAATMGTTKEAVTPLKQEILDLALDPSLTVNTTQAASAIEKLAQNGLTMTQILDGAGKSTVALANAVGDQEFTTSANIATGAMQAFNLTAGNLGTVADGVAGVLIKSKFNADDYALALSNAGAVASGTGLSLEDFNTILAGTASNFSSGSDAGTSLKTLLQNLSNPTGKAKEAMSDLGISIFDDSGKMRDMKDIVGDLHLAFEGMSDQQKATTADIIGGSDASRTLLGLAKMTGDEFATLSGEVNKNGQALQAAATRVDSISGAWAIFQGIIEAVQIQVGDKFLPLLRGITVAFTDMASKSAPMVVEFFGNIANLISGLIGKVTSLFDVFGEKGLAGVFASLGFGGSALFLKKLGELAVMMGLTGTNAASLGDIITTTLGGAFTWLTTNLFPMLTQAIEFVMVHFEEFKGALMGIGGVVAVSVFAAIVAGILSLVTPITLVIGAAALLGAAWAGNWGGIQDKTFAAWAIVQPILIELMTWLQVNIPIALQFLSNAWNTILLPAIIAVTGFLTGTVFPAFASFISTYIDVTSTRLQVLADTWTLYLLPAITAVWGFINTSLVPLFQSINNLVGAILTKALQAWAGLWRNVLLPAIKSVWDFLSANVLPIFAEMGRRVGEDVSPPIDNLSKNVLPPLSKGLQIVIGWIKDATGYFNAMAHAVSSFTLPSFLMPGSPPPMAIALQDVANAASNAGDAMGRFSQATLDSLLGVRRGMADTNSVIGAAKDDVEKYFDTFMEGSKAKFALNILGNVFREHSAEILNATDRIAKFREIAMGAVSNWQRAGFGTGNDPLSGISVFINAFDKRKAELERAQRNAFIQAGNTALTIGQRLNDIVQGSADVLDQRIKDLQAFIESGQESTTFNGELMNQWLAQIRLNEALQEQRDIQDDILQLKQNEQKLGFLEKQLDLVKTLNDAGLNVQDILGGISLGLDASIPDMIEATNRLVSAMINQVNQDLQLGSPSKVMMKKGQQTGQGFIEGLMGQIPNIMDTMKQAIMGPSMVSGPALGGGGGQRVVNNNFSMSVSSGAAPQAVIQQFEVMRAMVG